MNNLGANSRNITLLLENYNKFISQHSYFSNLLFKRYEQCETYYVLVFYPEPYMTAHPERAAVKIFS